MTKFEFETHCPSGQKCAATTTGCPVGQCLLRNVMSAAKNTEVLTPEQARIKHLEYELHMATQAGTIECMVRNKSVSEYICDLKKRLADSEKALREIVACEDMKDRIETIISTIPEGKNIVDHLEWSEWARLNREYGHRKTPAWEAARKAIHD